MEHDQKISQEEARERMEAGDVIVLDVREQEEYDSGHIPGAVLLPSSNVSPYRLTARKWIVT